MSFDLNINQILQYAFNIFASGQTVLYLYIGAAFALFILGGLLRLAKN